MKTRCSYCPSPTRLLSRAAPNRFPSPESEAEGRWLPGSQGWGRCYQTTPSACSETVMSNQDLWQVQHVPCSWRGWCCPLSPHCPECQHGKCFSVWENSDCGSHWFEGSSCPSLGAFSAVALVYLCRHLKLFYLAQVLRFLTAWLCLNSGRAQLALSRCQPQPCLSLTPAITCGLQQVCRS